jgi:hypothetical protein
MKKLFLLGMAFISFCILFSSCSEKSTKNTTQGGIKIYLADKPAAYDEVNIVVSQVSVHAADQDSESGWTVISDTIQTYDLLSLSNGAMALFANHPLDPAHYTQIRLKVTDGCNVVVDGTPYDLEIPSGEQSGIKINHQFEIQPGETYELLLDFDAERSIHQKGNGDYQMQPVIRAVAIATSGSISGIVYPDSIRAYALAGPDTVAQTHSDTIGYFKLVGLPTGLYSVQIVPDDTTYADTSISDVTVIAGETDDLGLIQLRKK